MLEHGPTPSNTYDNVNGLLSPIDLVRLLEDTLLVKTIVGLPRTNGEGRKEISIVARMEDQIAITK